MRTRYFPFGLAALVLILDRATKYVIERYVSTWDTYVVIPNFFNIVHAQNRGAAFGMFSEGDSGLRDFLLVGLSLAILGFIAGLLFKSEQAGGGSSQYTRLGLGLVFGGALGNVYDRIFRGSVTDFLDFYIADHHWPVFNVADSAITIGAALLLIDMWRTRHESVRTGT